MGVTIDDTLIIVDNLENDLRTRTNSISKGREEVTLKRVGRAEMHGEVNRPLLYAG